MYQNTIDLIGNYISMSINTPDPIDSKLSNLTVVHYPKSQTVFRINYANITNSKGGTSWGAESFEFRNMMSNTRVVIPITAIDGGQVSIGKTVTDVITLTSWAATNTAT